MAQVVLAPKPSVHVKLPANVILPAGLKLSVSATADPPAPMNAVSTNVTINTNFTVLVIVSPFACSRLMSDGADTTR